MASQPAAAERCASLPRVEFTFEEVFRMHRGLAYPRFPVRVHDQILEQGEPVSMVEDDAVGRELLPYWNLAMRLQLRDGVWTLQP